MNDSAPNFSLGINTGFAVNRFAEPEEWTRIIGEQLGLRIVQLTADMLNPSLGAKICAAQIKKIRTGCEQFDIDITSTFTGAFTRVNHLAHPDPDIRCYWVQWFKNFVDLSVDVGAQAMGSHFGIFTHKDNAEPNERESRRRTNIDGWHEIGSYAKERGLRFLTWEPMSISREQGETLAEARRLQDDVNRGAPIEFKMCLDVDHGNVASPNPDDTDPYAWLAAFASDAPQVHIKQVTESKSGHWPFTAEYNDKGIVEPARVVDTLAVHGATNTEMIFELGFREREPTDSTVVQALQESVNFWRPFVAT